MSWMQRLKEVYENNSESIGSFETRGKSQRFTLLPISHVTQSAQIEVVLDHQGEFYTARVVPKEQAMTLTPATIKSANRAGSLVAAHLLHDKLFYVAGDYLKYGGDPKRSENYSQYIDQMKAWAESEWSHPKVKLIYHYVVKGRLIEDLVNANILFVDHEDKLIEKWGDKETKQYHLDKPEIYKVVSGNSSEAFIRFTILSAYPNDPVVWEDHSIFRAFQKHYDHYIASQETEHDLCYVTGEWSRVTERHGSRLRNAGDMSKLISSNDQQGFTYRGRFVVPTQAVQIGYDISQKAHNALRWLIQRQGFRAEERSFVTFGVKQADVAQPFEGTLELFDPMGFLLGTDTNEVIDYDRTNQVVAEQVNNALKGRRHNFDVKGIENVIIMAVDAATRGRMSIVYYQELDSSLFLDNLSHWHATCRWHLSYFDSDRKKVVHYDGTPSTYHIVESIYGPRADDKVKKELYTRLLPCIVDRQTIPKDIVKSIFNRVKNPMSFEERQLSNPIGDWQRTLNIACALIRKLYEKEEVRLTLDETNTNRDYLFGRLLGVAEVLERNELRRRDENRATNAMRYFNAFSQHPARTWLTIRKQLHPYQVRQGENIWFYNKLIQEIESSIPPEQMNNNALGPLFLLGYSSQIRKLYEKNERKNEEENENDSASE